MAKKKEKLRKYKKSPFIEAISIRAKYYPEDRPALIYGHDIINWKTLYSRICKLANAFRGIGIKKQDKIGFIFHNTPEFLEINFAAQMIGAVPVPFNFRYVASEIEYTANNSDSVCLLLEEDVLEEVLKARENLPKVKNFILKSEKKVNGFLDYEELINSYSDKEKTTSVYENDLAVIIYTGGTTGRSKGVMLSYKNLLANQEAVIAFLINALPKVTKRKLLSEKYADSEFARKFNSAFEVLGGFLRGFFSHPDMKKAVIVLETPQETKGVYIKPLTICYRQDRIKIMSGMPPKDMITAKLYANIGEQFRDFTNLLPYPFTKKGKKAILPKLIKKFLFGGIKLSGTLGVRIKLIKSFMTPDEKYLNNLIVPPLFHLASYAFFTMFYTYVSGAYIMPKSKSFKAEEILSQVSDFKPGWMFLVPAMYKSILDYLEEHPDHDFDLTSINIGVSGASLLRAKYKKQLIKHFPNMVVFDAFGQTEMTSVATIKLDAIEETISDRSVGKTIQGVEIKIVDENGNEVEEGVVGEILYKGDTVMMGYYGDNEKTKQTIDDDGWLHSGDLGFKRKGELYTVERKKECINTGSEKVFPLEVEEVIIDHPAVHDVCVIGVPDETFGHIVRAVVILKEGKEVTEKEIIDWCVGKIAGYKKPRSVVFVDKFPKSPVGKVLRQKIREMYGKTS
ncbi:MAG: class I adenylate-forming enzyme family protein [Promethearchaeota archaeon]